MLIFINKLVVNRKSKKQKTKHDLQFKVILEVPVNFPI